MSNSEKSLVQKSQNTRKENEEGLWHAWVKSGKQPAHLRPLLSSLEPLIQKTVSRYRGADISSQALRAQAENQLIQGLNTYNPKKGGSLSTHLNWQMRGVGRFVERYQNIARIPGSRIRFVGRFQRAKSSLQDESDKPPTLNDIAKMSKIPLRQAKKLDKELRPVHVFGMHMGEGGTPLDLGSVTISADKERLGLIYPDLSPIEKQVVDLSMGRGGKKPISSTSALARKLGVSAARISNIRASIARKSKSLGFIR